VHDLFDSPSRDQLAARLARLESTSQRQWGKMDAAQMCAHCAVILEAGNGDRPMRQSLLGKLLSWVIRGRMLGPGRVPRGAPTDPRFDAADPRDFAVEKARLQAALSRFCERGPDHAATQTHPFLGSISGPEWGRLMGKHLDHHLQQFGV
jgi:hypothetical protein